MIKKGNYISSEMWLMVEASCLKIWGSMVQEGTANAKALRWRQGPQRRSLWLMHMMEKNVGVRELVQTASAQQTFFHKMLSGNSPKYEQTGRQNNIMSTLPATSRWQQQQHIWCHFLAGTCEFGNNPSEPSLWQDRHLCVLEFSRAQRSQVPRLSEPIRSHSGIWTGSNGTKRRLQTWPDAESGSVE